MIHVLDERLADEIRRFRLAFTCERCAAFDADTGRCSNGYPNEDHRDRAHAGAASAAVGTIVFCKEFELA